jgi:hemoglobin/transferrin/lactoferrin receptor protein
VHCWAKGAQIAAVFLKTAMRPSLVPLFVFALSIPAFAEDPAALPELDPVVVSASGLEQPSFDAAYRVDSLLDSDVVERAVRSLPDLLRQTPGVYIQRTSNAQASPFMRGFTGYHNVLLIDGVRLNNAAFRSGPNQYWATVDAYSLDRIELVRGQGSVLYGSDAVGGVLQSFTRGPVYAEQGSLSTGRVAGRYASAEQAYMGRIEGSVSEAGKAGFFIGGSWKDFGDLRVAELGELPQTGFAEWDGDAKFELWLAPEHKLTVYHQQVHQDDAWRTHRTVYARPWNGTSVGNELVHAFDQDRYLSYLKLEGALNLGWADDYTFTLSHHRQVEDRQRRRESGRTDLDGFQIDSYGAQIDFTKDLEWTQMLYGASYYQDRGSSYARQFNADGSFGGRGIQGPIGTDAIYHLAAAYVNSVTPLTPKLDLNLGGRFTYAGADIGQVEDPVSGLPIGISDSWNNAVGSARLVMKANDQLRFYGGLSQAFRAPNFSDLSRLDVSRSNEIETPAPELEPEKFITYEVGVRADWNRFKGEASWYITDIRSLILRAPTGAIVDGSFEVTKRNSEGGYVHGIDLSGEYLLTDALSLFGGFGWVDGVVNAFPTSAPLAVEEPISRLMPTQGFGGVRWQLCDSVSLEGLVFAAGDEDRLSSGDRLDTQRMVPGGTPGYTTATFRGIWTPDAWTTISVGVENAFDEDYRIHGSGQNEPGVNGVFAFERKF